MRECGLKHYINGTDYLADVSLPVRECGLKPLGEYMKIKNQAVTPRAGVWIETHYIICGREIKGSHSPCGSVD